MTSQKVDIQGVPVEVESRYRVEIQQWQATIHHPVYHFTVSEWAPTLQDATHAALKALLHYEAEMERAQEGAGSNGAPQVTV
jgi:hypothetical protein